MSDRSLFDVFLEQDGCDENTLTPDRINKGFKRASRRYEFDSSLSAVSSGQIDSLIRKAQRFARDAAQPKIPILETEACDDASPPLNVRGKTPYEVIVVCHSSALSHDACLRSLLRCAFGDDLQRVNDHPAEHKLTVMLLSVVEEHWPRPTLTCLQPWTTLWHYITATVRRALQTRVVDGSLFVLRFLAWFPSALSAVDQLTPLPSLPPPTPPPETESERRATMLAPDAISPHHMLILFLCELFPAISACSLSSLAAMDALLHAIRWAEKRMKSHLDSFPLLWLRTLLHSLVLARPECLVGHPRRAHIRNAVEAGADNGTNRVPSDRGVRRVIRDVWSAATEATDRLEKAMGDERDAAMRRVESEIELLGWLDSARAGECTEKRVWDMVGRVTGDGPCCSVLHHVRVVVTWCLSGTRTQSSGAERALATVNILKRIRHPLVTSTVLDTVLETPSMQHLGLAGGEGEAVAVAAWARRVAAACRLLCELQRRGLASHDHLVRRMINGGWLDAEQCVRGPSTEARAADSMWPQRVLAEAPIVSRCGVAYSEEQRQRDRTVHGEDAAHHRRRLNKCSERLIAPLRDLAVGVNEERREAVRKAIDEYRSKCLTWHDKALIAEQAALALFHHLDGVVNREMAPPSLPSVRATLDFLDAHVDTGLVVDAVNNLLLSLPALHPRVSAHWLEHLVSLLTARLDKHWLDVACGDAGRISKSLSTAHSLVSCMPGAQLATAQVAALISRLGGDKEGEAWEPLAPANDFDRLDLDANVGVRAVQNAAGGSPHPASAQFLSFLSSRPAHLPNMLVNTIQAMLDADESGRHCLLSLLSSIASARPGIRPALRQLIAHVCDVPRARTRRARDALRVDDPSHHALLASLLLCCVDACGVPTEAVLFDLIDGMAAEAENLCASNESGACLALTIVQKLLGVNGETNPSFSDCLHRVRASLLSACESRTRFPAWAWHVARRAVQLTATLEGMRSTGRIAKYSDRRMRVYGMVENEKLLVPLLRAPWMSRSLRRLLPIDPFQLCLVPDIVNGASVSELVLNSAFGEQKMQVAGRARRRQQASPLTDPCSLLLHSTSFSFHSNAVRLRAWIHKAGADEASQLMSDTLLGWLLPHPGRRHRDGGGQLVMCMLEMCIGRERPVNMSLVDFLPSSRDVNFNERARSPAVASPAPPRRAPTMSLAGFTIPKLERKEAKDVRVPCSTTRLNDDEQAVFLKVVSQVASETRRSPLFPGMPALRRAVSAQPTRRSETPPPQIPPTPPVLNRQSSRAWLPRRPPRVSLPSLRLAERLVDRALSVLQPPSHDRSWREQLNEKRERRRDDQGDWWLSNAMCSDALLTAVALADKGKKDEWINIFVSMMDAAMTAAFEKPSPSSIRRCHLLLLFVIRMTEPELESQPPCLSLARACFVPTIRTLARQVVSPESGSLFTVAHRWLLQCAHVLSSNGERDAQWHDWTQLADAVRPDVAASGCSSLLLPLLPPTTFLTVAYASELRPGKRKKIRIRGGLSMIRCGRLRCVSLLMRKRQAVSIVAGERAMQTRRIWRMQAGATGARMALARMLSVRVEGLTSATTTPTPTVPSHATPPPPPPPPQPPTSTEPTSLSVTIKQEQADASVTNDGLHSVVKCEAVAGPSGVGQWSMRGAAGGGAKEQWSRPGGAGRGGAEPWVWQGQFQTPARSAPKDGWDFPF